MIDLTRKKYFLFDLDGTLVDLEQLNYSCFADAVKKHTGNSLTYAEYMTHMAGVGSVGGFTHYFVSIGRTDIEVNAIVKEYREQKKYSLEHNFDQVVTVKKGAHDFLKKLRQLGKNVALGTSTHKTFAYIILEKSGLKPLFDEIVTVNDVARTKPFTDIYDEALRRIGGNKSDAVIFEDSKNGVQCAKNTGIDFIVVHNKGKNDSVVAENENVITDYTELEI